MKKLQKKFVAMILVLSVVVSSSLGVFASESTNTDIFDSLRQNIYMDGDVVVEELYFVDIDGIETYVTQSAYPDNTVVLRISKGDSVTEDILDGDYDLELARYKNDDSLLITPYGTKSVFVGTVEYKHYMGPEYYSVADAMRVISTFFGGRVGLAAELAGYIFAHFGRMIPTWIRVTVSTYEIHGEGNIGFLGYYKMVRQAYAYSTSNTSGTGYFWAGVDTYESTTPG